jgi:hypothetical protein
MINKLPIDSKLTLLSSESNKTRMKINHSSQMNFSKLRKIRLVKKKVCIKGMFPIILQSRGAVTLGIKSKILLNNLKLIKKIIL